MVGRFGIARRFASLVASGTESLFQPASAHPSGELRLGRLLSASQMRIADIGGCLAEAAQRRRRTTSQIQPASCGFVIDVSAYPMSSSPPLRAEALANMNGSFETAWLSDFARFASATSRTLSAHSTGRNFIRARHWLNLGSARMLSH